MKDLNVVDINKEECIQKACEFIDNHPACYKAWMEELFNVGQDLVYPQKYISWLNCYLKNTPSINLAQIPMRALYDGKGLKTALKLFRENGANEFVIADTLKIIEIYYKDGNTFLEAYNNPNYSINQTEVQRVLK